jgi:hypothetical protein
LDNRLATRLERLVGDVAFVQRRLAGQDGNKDSAMASTTPNTNACAGVTF